MSTRFIPPMLAFVGVALVIAAVYIQSLIMDLERANLAEHLTMDSKLPYWWLAIGAPFMVGLSYIIVGIVLLRRRPAPRLLVRALAACLLLAALLCLASSILGLMALVSVASFLWAARQEARRGADAT